MAFFAPGTVLAGLAENLTHSKFCVGLLISLGTVGWMWPGLFVGNLVEPLKRKKPLYIVSAAFRFGLMFVMGVAVLLWRGGPFGLFWMLLVIYVAFSSAGGTVVVPFMDIVGKAIPRARMPMLWAYRRSIGGVLGFVGSLIVGYVLSEKSGLEYPYNYGLLFILGALVCAPSYGFFIMVREPVHEVPEERSPFLDYLRRGWHIFRTDHNFRRLFFLRATWSVSRMSQLALFVPMAIEYFKASPQETGGWFTAVILLMGGVSSIFAGAAIRRFGEARTMKACAVLDFLSPFLALALALAHLYEPTRPLAARYYLPAYIVMYVLATTAVNGNDIAGTVYLLALPSPQLRPCYVAFINTMGIPLLFAPAVAGFLADLVSYPAVLAVSCAAALASFVVAGTLGKHTADAEGNP
jgi:MFS family permease